MHRKQDPRAPFVNALSNRAFRRGLFAAILTFTLIGGALLPFDIEADLNEEYGGNAVVNNGNYEVIKPNTEGHAQAVDNLATVAIYVIPIASAVLVGRWQYRRYRSRSPRT